MQHLNKLIVCGLISVFSLTANAQNDSIKCFDLDGQKRILTKFIQLDECQALRKMDSVHIRTMDSLRIDMLSQLKEQHKTIQHKNKVIFRRNKTILIGIPTAFVVGFILNLFL